MKKNYTLSVFTDNRAGLLNRITIAFTRRKINIESLIASESEVEGIYRYTIVINETEEAVAKVTKQLEKQVEVYKAFYHADEEVVSQEIALYKVATDILTTGGKAEKLIRHHNARLLSVERDFAVIEKTGYKEDTEKLFEDLEPFGILEFARSGRVAISKPMKELRSYLEELKIEMTNI